MKTTDGGATWTFLGQGLDGLLNAYDNMRLAVDLTAPNHSGSTCNVETRQEVIYPTEWEPGKRLPAADGMPSQREFSNASAFDT